MPLSNSLVNSGWAKEKDAAHGTNGPSMYTRTHGTGAGEVLAWALCSWTAPHCINGSHMLRTISKAYLIRCL